MKRADFASDGDAVRAVFEAALRRGKGDTAMFGLRLRRGSFDHFMQQLKRLVLGNMSDVERIEDAFGPTCLSIFQAPIGWIRRFRASGPSRPACGIATRTARRWSASPLDWPRDTTPPSSGTTWQLRGGDLKAEAARLREARCAGLQAPHRFRDAPRPGRYAA
ncbi:hypothetical protein NHU_03816 [Rhodovulum sulfidophilum]|uniref:Sulphotransferase Stf0 domain-containing protein n=1 Tax=Rhodovulum sulfidophilum TaxID=35806 RepID=A0A0D6B7X1_RHOSU|nr:hypothetical protein NHU_03816 [Rhodovulum sulfidophilum]